MRCVGELLFCVQRIYGIVGTIMWDPSSSLKWFFHFKFITSTKMRSFSVGKSPAGLDFRVTLSPATWKRVIMGAIYESMSHPSVSLKDPSTCHRKFTKKNMVLLLDCVCVLEFPLPFPCCLQYVNMAERVIGSTREQGRKWQQGGRSEAVRLIKTAKSLPALLKDFQQLWHISHLYQLFSLNSEICPIYIWDALS